MDKKIINSTGLKRMRSLSFRLELADGQRWHIIADKNASSWIKRLVTIMELKTCKMNQYQKLIIIKKDKNRDGDIETYLRKNLELKKSFPLEGWFKHDLGLIRFWSHPEIQDIICEIGDGNRIEIEVRKMWMLLGPIYERAIGNGGLLLHGGLVEKDGKGIFLGASGGVGKSTCCQRIPTPWHALCDDETLIVKNGQKFYMAHPFPTWSDYLWQRSERTWNVEKSFPLSAIFFLERSETDEIVPIGQGGAAIRLNQLAGQVLCVSWRSLGEEEGRARKMKLFNNASDLSKKVPSFILRVSLNGQFWREMGRVLDLEK